MLTVRAGSPGRVPASGIRHLVAQGVVDRERLGIGGGSYRGYATLVERSNEPKP
jgi:hypothetical protein